MTYEEAYAKAYAASAKFIQARNDYLAGKIDDAAFLAAKAEHDATHEEFDAAYAAAQQ